MQPRVSARYQLNSLLAFKAAYTQMKQYIHLLTSLPIALPTDLWVPITQKIKPMSADQYSAGAYFTGIKNWELSIEGYYKKMNNVLEYKDGVSFYGNSSRWEDKVEMGTGRSYGIELLLQKTEGRNTGWLSYTCSFLQEICRLTNAHNLIGRRETGSKTSTFRILNQHDETHQY